jgi:hypothetical protein
MKEPVCNNVYGYLSCKGSLERVADTLRYRLNLDSAQVSVKKSQFDGTQTLRIVTEMADLETTKVEEPNLYLFNGAVSGSEPEVYNYIAALHAILAQGGFESSFEIYDESFECVKVIKA